MVIIAKAEKQSMVLGIRNDLEDPIDKGKFEQTHERWEIDRCISEGRLSQRGNSRYKHLRWNKLSTSREQSRELWPDSMMKVGV